MHDLPVFMYRGHRINCMPLRTPQSTWVAQAVIARISSGDEVPHVLTTYRGPFEEMADAVKLARHAAEAHIDAELLRCFPELRTRCATGTIA